MILPIGLFKGLKGVQGVKEVGLFKGLMGSIVD